MKIGIAQKRGYVQVDLDGDLADVAVPVVREEVDHLLAGKADKVLWNLTSVPKMSGAVFCEILRGLATLKLREGQSVLLSPCDEVRAAVTKLGVDSLVPVAADEAIAVRLLCPAPSQRRSEFVSSSLLGEILMDLGVLNEAGLRQALEEQRGNQGREKLGSILLRLNIVTPDQILSALETQYQRRIQRLGMAAPPPSRGEFVKRNLLGQILQEIGVIDRSGLDRALEEQRRGGNREKLGDVLLRLRIVTPDQLLRALEAQARR
ncbi:MAG: hypothetical protein HY814_00115 [Candidatus Riflebacteria bacterium]|nr:hypothetical protein [Candidatus Riflebacteria bacterium]